MKAAAETSGINDIAQKYRKKNYQFKNLVFAF